MRADYADIERVMYLPNNPKDHDLGSIGGAMGEFGFLERVLINEQTGHLVAGHGRVAQLRMLRMQWLKAPDRISVPRNVKVDEAGNWYVPCDYDVIPEKDEMRVAIALNRLTETGGWVEGDLVHVLSDLAQQGEEMLRWTGFDGDDLDALIKGMGLEGVDKAREKVEHDKAYGRAEELQEKWQVQAGDVYRVGEHAVMCGDSTVQENWQLLLSVVGRKKIDGVFTSPPYAKQRARQYDGIEPDKYVDWWENIQANARRFIQDDGSFFVNIKSHVDQGERSLYVIDLIVAMARRWGWSYVDEFCWLRPGLPREVRYTFKNAFESVYHFAATPRMFKFYPDNVTLDSDGVPDNSGKGGGPMSDLQGHDGWLFGEQGYSVGKAYPSNVIKAYQNEKVQGHEASFPVELPTFFIQAYSKTGDLWIDPFVGSGTTILAAHQQGRIGIGCDNQPKYIAVTLERLVDELEVQPEKVDQIAKVV